GRWWLYPLCWLGPWMTVWRGLNRLRAIGEHGGMERSKGRRRTPHHIRQSWSGRFWVVPYRTGWHLAHPAAMGVPWRNPPGGHQEVVASGWVTDGLVHPGARAFCRACAAASTPAATVSAASSSSAPRGRSAPEAAVRCPAGDAHLAFGEPP